MKNRKLYLLLTTLAVLALLLAACGGGETTAAANTDPEGQAAVPNQSGETTAVTNTDPESPAAVSGQGLDAFPLMIGTLKLEGTEIAVTAEQAETLLPWWQLLQGMAASDTTAQAEIDAVAKQINAEMTAEQLAYIGAIDFSELDMRALYEELGIVLGQRGQGAGEGGAVGGGAGAGGGPGAGGGIPGGGEPSPELQATRDAIKSGQGDQLVNPIIVQALIDLLQGKVE